MELLFFWVVMAVIAGMIASSKGSSFFGFFLYGLLIWPIAIVHALLMRSDSAAPSHAAAAPQPFRAAERPAREVLGVVQGVPYWSEGRGRVGATINGEAMIFPSVELLTAAVSGQSHVPVAAPLISRPLRDEMIVSSPVILPDGRVTLVANGVTRYFNNSEDANSFIDRFAK